MIDSPIIIALDYPDLSAAMALIQQLDPRRCRLKVGKGMFTRYGPQWVKQLIAAGFDVFLDLKFHDIPDQVAKACTAAADMNVWMITVHAQGGRRMLEAARNAVDQCKGRKPLLVAVTVLTSLGVEDFQEFGYSDSLAVYVQRLARLAQHTGLDGVVCSPQEISTLRSAFGLDFCLVTPGIRPTATSKDDQQRTMTPREAILAGADYLVIGRPITHAADPIQALHAIEIDLPI